MPDLEDDYPRIKSHVAGFAARGISSDLLNLQQLAEPLEGGVYYPLFLICIQQLFKSQGENWLQSTFNSSKINLLSMLPGNLFIYLLVGILCIGLGKMSARSFVIILLT